MVQEREGRMVQERDVEWIRRERIGRTTVSTADYQTTIPPDHLTTRLLYVPRQPVRARVSAVPWSPRRLSTPAPPHAAHSRPVPRSDCHHFHCYYHYHCHYHYRCYCYHHCCCRHSQSPVSPTRQPTSSPPPLAARPLHSPPRTPPRRGYSPPCPRPYPAEGWRSRRDCPGRTADR